MLTLSVVFEAMSLNYGEGVSNISELKKLSRANELISYMSRQALRYEIYRMLKEMFKIDSDKEDPLTKEKDVVQFKTDTNIKKYIEADLFGYMKTKKGEGSSTRPSTVRITPAISLEPMLMDVEFGTNLNFAQRAKANPNPFQFEHHLSLYSYTITVELDRIGEDPNDNISIKEEEKAKRVNMLLEVLKFLNRNIKGRMENLSPLFAIGGVYDVKNPFFLGRIKIYHQNDRKYSIDTNIIKSVLETSIQNKPIKDNTHIGFIEGYWKNEEDIKALLDNENIHNINGFFDALKSQVNKYYGIEE